MLAQELRSFDLPQVEIEGLFMTTKMAGAGHNRNGSSSPTKQLRDDGPKGKILFPPREPSYQSTQPVPGSQAQLGARLGLRQFNPAIVSTTIAAQMIAHSSISH